MNDTSRPLTPKPDRPVEPLALLVIHEIHKAASELGFPAFLVGAMARIILLENIYGLKAGRATTDVDFAFALDNWDQFRTIKTFLIANAKFVESKHVIHQLFFQPPGLEHKFKVDLIPFGGIETSPNTIAWPPDMAVMMNVAGFSDALAATVTVEVSPGIDIAVASLPGIAIRQILIPNEVLQVKFENAVKSTHEQIELLREATRKVEKVRNILLPRLISGKLSVEKLDIQFPPSMAAELKAAPVAHA
jgi:hypothetical protein